MSLSKLPSPAEGNPSISRPRHLCTLVGVAVPVGGTADYDCWPHVNDPDPFAALTVAMKRSVSKANRKRAGSRCNPRVALCFPSTEDIGEHYVEEDEVAEGGPGTSQQGGPGTSQQLTAPPPANVFTLPVLPSSSTTSATHTMVPESSALPIIQDMEKPSSTTAECVAGSSQQMGALLPARVIVLPFQGSSTTILGASFSSQGEGSSGMGNEPGGSLGERINSRQQLFGSSKKDMLIHYKDLKQLIPASFLKDNIIDFYLRFMEDNMERYKKRCAATLSAGLFLKLQLIYKNYSYNLHKAFDPSYETSQLKAKKFYVMPLNMDTHWIFFIAVHPFRILKKMDNDYVWQWQPQREMQEAMDCIHHYLRRPCSDGLDFLEKRNNEEKNAEGLDSLKVRNNEEGTAHEERKIEVPMEHLPAEMDIPHPAEVCQSPPRPEKKETTNFLLRYLSRPCFTRLDSLDLRNNEEKNADGLESLELRNKDEGADHAEKNVEGLDSLEERNKEEGTAYEERKKIEVPMEHLPAKMDIQHPADHDPHEVCQSPPRLEMEETMDFIHHYVARPCFVRLDLLDLRNNEEKNADGLESLELRNKDEGADHAEKNVEALSSLEERNNDEAIAQEEKNAERIHSLEVRNNEEGTVHEERKIEVPMEHLPAEMDIPHLAVNNPHEVWQSQPRPETEEAMDCVRNCLTRPCFVRLALLDLRNYNVKNADGLDSLKLRNKNGGADHAEKNVEGLDSLEVRNNEEGIAHEEKNAERIHSLEVRNKEEGTAHEGRKIEVPMEQLPAGMDITHTADHYLHEVWQSQPRKEMEEAMDCTHQDLGRPCSDGLDFLDVRNNEEKKADGPDSFEVRYSDAGTAHEERKNEVPMEHFPAEMDIPNPADHYPHEGFLEQVSPQKPRNKTSCVTKQKKNYKLLRRLWLLKKTEEKEKRKSLLRAKYGIWA